MSDMSIAYPYHVCAADDCPAGIPPMALGLGPEDDTATIYYCPIHGIEQLHDYMQEAYSDPLGFSGLWHWVVNAPSCDAPARADGDDCGGADDGARIIIRIMDGPAQDTPHTYLVCAYHAPRMARMAASNRMPIATASLPIPAYGGLFADAPLAAYAPNTPAYDAAMAAANAPASTDVPDAPAMPLELPHVAPSAKPAYLCDAHDCGSPAVGDYMPPTSARALALCAHHAAHWPPVA